MRNTKNNKELKNKDFIIEGDALKRYTGDESIVTIPNVSRICSFAFDYCENVKKIIIPNTVKEIEFGAFSDCSSLESVVIPSSVTNIKGSIFDFCDSLKEVIVDKENPVYDSRDNCNAIIETKTNTLISACSNSFIPNSIESIKRMSFSGCDRLKEITIPSSVKEIGLGAFFKCSSLESVVIPSSVTNIRGHIFDFCDSLKEVIVDKDNPVYDSRDNCNAIIETKTNALISACSNSFIPNSIESINSMSFSGFNQLKEITIPSSVTKIEYAALSDCSNLRKVEILCKKILDLGNDVLFGCYDLESLTISCFKEFEIGDSGKSKYHIGSLFGEREYDDSYRIHYLWSKDKNKTFYLPNSLKLVILKDMKSVPFVSFFGCDSITHIELPSSIERIENGAFACCTGLVDITYNGTMSEWNAIEKEDYWDDRTGDYSIHCLDGDIKKISNQKDDSIIK